MLLHFGYIIEHIKVEGVARKKEAIHVIYEETSERAAWGQRANGQKGSERSGQHGGSE